jgi:predicted TIM-barrel fold metal-dependent hydrolase
MTWSPDDRYTVISADCHGGGELHEYRDYLPRDLQDDFDAWVAGYELPYEDLKGELGERNWDSDRRLKDLESDGIVAEVIYPNTVPPFFPKVSLGAQPPPPNVGDVANRWAGLQAHNRWLADFCARAPGRRAGIVQIMLHDIDAAVREVRWAKDAGLFGGVLLPGTPPGSGLPPLWDVDYYGPLWAVCEELGFPVNHHSGSAAPPFGDTDIDQVILLIEVTWWAHRAFSHLVVSGAFERYPGLRLVLTEQGTAWIPDELQRLDYFFHRMRTAVGSQEREWGLPVVSKLSLTPSEYWARNCYVGSSFIRPAEVPLRHQVGIDKVMWGSDYPHKEGAFPYSREALRAAFADVPPDEVHQMVCLNAARVYGFDVSALAPLAAAVGPTVGEIAVPIVPGQLPAEAEKCPALIGLGAAE